MSFLNSFPITKRLMTPDEVLALLQHRLTFIATQRRKPAPQLLRTHSIYHLLCLQMDRWTPALGQFSGEYWSDVADSFNNQFILDLEEHKWLSVFRRKDATVGDLCDFIARHAEREEIPEIRLSNNPCKSAGLFLALRERMRRMSNQTLDINPSSQLPDRLGEALMLNDAMAVLTSDNSFLPQHITPPLHITRRIAWLWVLMLTMSVVLAALVIAVMITKSTWLLWPVVASLGGLIVLFALVFYYSSKYDRWHWPEMTTYRDLVRALNKQMLA